MEDVVNRTRFTTCLTLALVVTSAVSAQGFAQDRQAIGETAKAPPSTLKGRNPKPEDATRAILAAFDHYEVVGMDAAHGNKDLDDLILHLIRDPGFPSKVNDIAVECGNSLYQPILDRYMAGDDVPLSEVRQVWRNTTQPMCSVSGFYEMLFPLVRRINQKLLTAKKLRVLAGDPALDWSKVKYQSDVMLDRDASAASVMETQVLSKHRKALMLFGTGHLFHSNKTTLRGLESAVERYEINYPGVTFVVGTNIVSRNPIPPAVTDEMKARMASWPVPSLVQNLKSTWLTDVDRYYFSKMVDAYLYLGAADLILAEPRPAEIFLNKDYMTELRGRAAINGDPFITAQADPDQIPDQDFSPFLFNPETSLNVSQSLGIGPQPSTASAKEGVTRSIPEPAQPIHLSPQTLKAFAGKYAPESPSESTIPPIEIVADQEGLSVDLGLGGKRRFVPLSPLEFMQNDAPIARITFTKDENGQIAGLIFRGVGTTRATKMR